MQAVKLASIGKPDMQTILNCCKQTKRLYVIEEVSNHGCIADCIFASVAESQTAVLMKKRNLGDGYVSHGTRKELLRQLKLDADGICTLILEDQTLEEQKAP